MLPWGLHWVTWEKMHFLMERGWMCSLLIMFTLNCPNMLATRRERANGCTCVQLMMEVWRDRDKKPSPYWMLAAARGTGKAGALWLRHAEFKNWTQENTAIWSRVGKERENPQEKPRRCHQRRWPWWRVAQKPGEHSFRNDWCCQTLPEQRTLKIKVQRHRTRMFLMTFIRMDKTELGGGRRWMTSTGSEAVETLVCGGHTMKRQLLLNGFKVERQQWHWLHWEYIPVSLMTLCSSFSFLGYRRLLLTLWFDLMYPSLPIPTPQGPQDPRIISVGHESCFKSPWPAGDRISICLRGELSPTAKYFLVLINVENEVTWGQPSARKKASR